MTSSRSLDSAPPSSNPPAAVALQACADYQPPTVQEAVDRCVELLGGWNRVVQPGQRVFCKVNLLVSSRPEQAICTHPEVVRAVVRSIKRVGGIPVVGDNPAVQSPTSVIKRLGLLAVLREEDVEVAEMDRVAVLENPAAKVFRTFEVSRAVLDCDVLLNLPKLKTHALAYLTAASKNLFGLIPGTTKAQWHFRAQDPVHFFSLLLDLLGAVQRHFSGSRSMFHLCDGILAMEGDGPGPGGTPRSVGALLASADATALDRVVCAVAGLDHRRVPTLAEAASRGLGQDNLDLITCVGTPLSRWDGIQLKPPAGASADIALSLRLMRNRFLKRLLLDRPVVDGPRCKGCERCQHICPAKALILHEKTRQPAINLDACIRCYCCAEVCPEGALARSRPPWMGRILGHRSRT